MNGPYSREFIRSIDDSFGRHARQRRELLGYSQLAVTQLMLDRHGIDWHQTVVGKIELGVRQVKMKEAFALASVYGISVEGLCGGQGLDANMKQAGETMPTPSVVEQRLGPSLVASRRVKELRTKCGWSAEVLAKACSDAGMPELNRSVLANIESGRRQSITLEEALVLAFVLDVAPVHLIVPVEEGDESSAVKYLVAPDRMVELKEARGWIKGEAALPDQDPRTYYSEVPRADFLRVMPSSHPSG